MVFRGNPSMIVLWKVAKESQMLLQLNMFGVHISQTFDLLMI